MTNGQFSLTFRYRETEWWERGEWEAFCLEWEISGQGSTMEAAKEALCSVILINARAILQVKDVHPTLKPQMIAVAQQVMENEVNLPKLLQETA